MKWNFHPRVTKKKQCRISRAEVLVFGLFEFPRDLTQFCGISWGKEIKNLCPATPSQCPRNRVPCQKIGKCWINCATGIISVQMIEKYFVSLSPTQKSHWSLSENFSIKMNGNTILSCAVSIMQVSHTVYVITLPIIIWLFGTFDSLKVIMISFSGETTICWH